MTHAESPALTLEGIIVSLKLLGATSVEVTYNGEDDSGQIENARAYGGGGEVPVTEEEAEVFRTWVGEKLLRKIDWYNNDGGRGHVDINLVELTVEHHHTQRSSKYRQNDFPLSEPIAMPYPTD